MSRAHVFVRGIGSLRRACVIRNGVVRTSRRMNCRAGNLDPPDVRKLAKLAQIHVTDEEVNQAMYNLCIAYSAMFKSCSVQISTSFEFEFILNVKSNLKFDFNSNDETFEARVEMTIMYLFILITNKCPSSSKADWVQCNSFSIKCNILNSYLDASKDLCHICDVDWDLGSGMKLQSIVTIFKAELQSHNWRWFWSIVPWSEPGDQVRAPLVSQSTVFYLTLIQ